MSPEYRGDSLQRVGDDVFEATRSGRAHEERLIINKDDFRGERSTHTIYDLPTDGRIFAERETTQKRLSCKLTPEHTW